MLSEFLGIIGATFGTISFILIFWFKEHLRLSIKNEYDEKLQAIAYNNAKEINRIKNRYDKEIHSFKHTYNKNLLLLQRDIEKTNTEDQIRFASLHTRTADEITNLYSKLVGLADDAREAIKCHNQDQTYEPPEPALLLNLTEKSKTLKKEYQHKRVYFSKKVCDSIELMCDTWDEVIHTFYENNTQNLEEAWDKACIITGKHIPAILDSLRVEFRELLGLEPKTKAFELKTYPNSKAHKVLNAYME